MNIPESCAITDKRIFLTNKTYNGNFGGQSGANSTCQEQATRYGLGGNWKALLGTTNSELDLLTANTNYCSLDRSSVMVKNRVYVGAYTRDILSAAIYGGHSVAFGILPEVPGRQVSYWTGGDDYNCDSWTSDQNTSGPIAANSKYFGRISAMSFNDPIWKWFTLQSGGAGAYGCSAKLRLVCFED